MSLNKVQLIGHLGNDPELRATQDGREIASFSLATAESWKDKQGERQSKTEWHKVVVFSQGLVKVIKNYVKKGSKLYIEGQLQTRKWTDKEGVERYVTEIVMQNFNSNLIMLDSKNSNQDSSEPKMDKNYINELDKQNSGVKVVDLDDIDDEIPF